MPQEDFAAIYRNPTYDQHAKRLLSQRIIMARLLKRIVPEFKDVEIADIAEKYIEGKPQIGDVPMERDKTNAVRNGLGYPREIFGDATENIGVTEGCIRFDILFHARVPQSGELMTLLINVEAQRTQRRSKLGYAILRRAVYYASRLISSQKETEFTGSAYDEIKKIYTIWLCMDSPVRKSVINRYALHEYHVLNSYEEKRADYDLMSIVILYLGEDRQPHEDWFIRFLRILFKETNLSAAEKRRILKDEFDMDTTADIDEEMMAMCNLSTGIYEQGMENQRMEMVLSMLKEKLPIEMIARISKLSLECVQELGKAHGLLEGH